MISNNKKLSLSNKDVKFSETINAHFPASNVAINIVNEITLKLIVRIFVSEDDVRFFQLCHHRNGKA